MRLRVNIERCRGHGVCAGNAPDVFLFADDDTTYVAFDVIPEDREEDARMAVHNCPEQALEII